MISTHLAAGCRTLPDRLSRIVYYRFLRKRNLDPTDCEVPLRHNKSAKIILPKSRDRMYEAIYCTGGFETEVSRIVRRRAREGGIFCDVGANIGYFSLLWLAGSDTNRSVLIEPDERLNQIARLNLERNGISHLGRVISCAAGSHHGTFLFDADPECTGWGKLTMKVSHRTRKVDIMPLDDIVGEDVPVVMKVDVEGAEALVLRGARRVIDDPRLLTVVLECNSPGARDLGLNPEEPLDILRGAGFTLTPLENPKPVRNWLAMRSR